MHEALGTYPNRSNLSLGGAVICAQTQKQLRKPSHSDCSFGVGDQHAHNTLPVPSGVPEVTPGSLFSGEGGGGGMKHG